MKKILLYAAIAAIVLYFVRRNKGENIAKGGGGAKPQVDPVAPKKGLVSQKVEAEKGNGSYEPDKRVGFPAPTGTIKLLNVKTSS